MREFRNIYIPVLFALLVFLCSSCSHKFYDPDPGVSFDLAEYRAEKIKQLEYDIRFRIPERKTEQITGQEVISFKFSGGKHPIVIDFRESKEKLKSVTVRGKKVEYIFQNEHIIIPEKYFYRGGNTVEIEFIAGNQSLNRSDDFLYTLFVPDRARTAFPCFDQPDMKAMFSLTLDVPDGWEAIGNGKVKQRKQKEGRKVVEFEKTKPLSTYLFAFVIGKFNKLTKTHDNREITLYHRENNPQKLKANTGAIFEQVFHAINWLEEYTGMDYPFAKYDVIAIPSFQYNGMEHTGATLYRASSLFLEESATQDELLERANLIAHETAHMWFGDLVTMKWFNDVWLKEVFANFIAGKIVSPMFPDVDHRLHFLLTHYPKAYSVDRTDGANPIGQQLDNLEDAGTLYGAIIYHKAPIVMNHLEQMIGGAKMRSGLQEYLEKYAYKNATWDDLINILDEKTFINLPQWSNMWVYEPGMPRIEIVESQDDSVKAISFTQVDPWGYNRLWKQRLNFLFGSDEETRILPYNLSGPVADIDLSLEEMKSNFILPNGMGLAYGYFSLDKKTIDYLLKNVPVFKESLTRGVSWLDLYENLLNGKIAPHEFFEGILRALPQENNKQITHLISGYLENVYWDFLTTEDRISFSGQVEELLWGMIERHQDSGVKRNLFNTWRKIVLTPQGVEKMMGIWDQQATIPGLELSENDYMNIAFDLALHDVVNSRGILIRQLNRLKNEDRRRKMSFIIPAISSDPLARDAFFESLRDSHNREVEDWVLSALACLHHPLRASTSIKYVLPSLEILEELQVTGDIFFPKNWLDTTLKGYSSFDVVDIVEKFLADNPTYPASLKNKILQSIDPVRRAAEIKQRYY